ncbi:hypothetical protein PISMIDRAFT_685002, partial [Pisolithus microcarpus 441]
ITFETVERPLNPFEPLRDRFEPPPSCLLPSKTFNLPSNCVPSQLSSHFCFFFMVYLVSSSHF